MGKELVPSVDDVRLPPGDTRGRGEGYQGTLSCQGQLSRGTVGGVLRGQLEEILLTQEDHWPGLDKGVVRQG